MYASGASLDSTYSYQMLGICVGSAAALADALAWKHDVERNTSVHGNERHGLPVNRNVATGGRPQNQHGKKRRERNSTHGSGSINATDHTAQGRVTVDSTQPRTPMYDMMYQVCIYLRNIRQTQNLAC